MIYSLSVIILRIIIDADACPVTKIATDIAKSRKLEVIYVFDTSHVFEDSYATCIIVDKGRDNADLVLANLCCEGDVVITQDYGLASMVLAKKAKCINQSGLIYTEFNIDSLLAVRHMNFNERRKNSKHHIKGPKKRTTEDDMKFIRAFIALLDS